MKRYFLIILSLSLFLIGCSRDPEQLPSDKLEGLTLEDKVVAIINNTEAIDEDFNVIIEDNSVAVVYSTKYIPDSKLVLDDSKESFPNLAMLLVEHLSVLDFDEIVITSYEPKESMDMTRVSSFFKKDTISELDFEKWKDERTQRFYRHSDGYLIRGNVWEGLSDEVQEKIGKDSKNATNSDSQFWEYYGSYVE